MRLREIYETAYREGIGADVRGKDGVSRLLERARKTFDDLPDHKKWEFDQETLVNPFADTRILVGDPEKEISKMLVGIDLEVGEVLLAHALRAKGIGHRSTSGAPS